VRGALGTGLRPGIVDTDLGYFASNPVTKLHKPTFELGFTPSTHYKQWRLGASNAYDGVLWVEGHAYCPQMPGQRITATVDRFQRTIDEANYRERIQARTEHKLRTVGKANKSGAFRMICTSGHHDAAPTAPSQRDTASTASAEERSDTSCRKERVSVYESDLLRRQAFTYGSPKWQDFHSRSRTTAEAVNARLKRDSVDQHPLGVGFSAAQVFLTLSLTAYNLRETARFEEHWHELRGRRS
jgi:hypothetical protein